MFEATILGEPIDTQTYVKVLLSTFYDMRDSIDGGSLLQILQTIFKNDVGETDFKFGSTLVAEFMEADVAKA